MRLKGHTFSSFLAALAALRNADPPDGAFNSTISAVSFTFKTCEVPSPFNGARTVRL